MTAQELADILLSGDGGRKVIVKVPIRKPSNHPVTYLAMDSIEEFSGSIVLVAD
jgi:hypothetical protein